MRPKSRTAHQRVGTAEALIARLAHSAHGVVTRAGLLRAGLTVSELKHRLRSGALIRVHAGVYRAGHRAPSVYADYLAAVRACGVGAALAGRAAAHLLGLIKGRPPPAEVIAPTERRVPGVVTHRARSSHPGERTSWRGIPVTTPPRTLVDLAAVLDSEALARACHEAGVLHRTTPAQVEEVLARRPNSPGAGALRAVMRGEVRVALSRLESRFLQRLRAAGLPLPVTNRVASGRRVDCRWPDHRLAVELDSYRFHNSRYAWEQDRRREREARGRGDELRRFTHEDVFRDPSYMLRELRRLLEGPSRTLSAGRAVVDGDPVGSQ